MSWKISERVLLPSLRVLVLSSMLMLLFAGAVEPASALGAPSITEPDPIDVKISVNSMPYGFEQSLHATDPDGGDTLTWSVLTPPMHASSYSLTNATNPSVDVNYAPATDYIGTDFLVVRVTDSADFYDTVQINITIAPAVGLVVQDVDDQGYNTLAYQGLLDAESGLGVTAKLYETPDSANFQASFEQCATDGNGLCLGVGFWMGDAITNAANAYPATDFAIIDYTADTLPGNLRGILFNEKQAGYLAGALAGKMTTTNVVGVVGGMEAVPAVVSFVEGYRNGAQCAGKKVKVLSQYAGTFTDPDLGASIAESMINQNADVIFGAAGPTGNGAILYSAQHSHWSIGVDTDQYLSVFGSGAVPGHDRILTSAMKRADTGVYETVEDFINGTFTGGNVTYDLSVDGVGLAPYHETDTLIPADTKTYVDHVRSGIIAGSIDVDETCRYSGRSVGTLDGWVLESTETSSIGGSKNNTLTYFYLGDDAQDRQYRSILSFNTSALPDAAVVTKVTLKIRKQGVVGIDPFTTHGNILVDIRKGPFASLGDLQPADFQAKAHKTGVGTFTNTPLADGWYKINLLSSAFAYVNPKGATQFRLYFATGDNDDLGADYLKFYSGNAGAAYRPQLIISYTWP